MGPNPECSPKRPLVAPKVCPPVALPSLLCVSHHMGQAWAGLLGFPAPSPPAQPQRAVSDPSQTRPLAPQKDTEQEASARMGGKVLDGQRTVFPRGPHWPVLWLPGQWGGGQSDASCLHTGPAQMPFLVTRYTGP